MPSRKAPFEMCMRSMPSDSKMAFMIARPPGKTGKRSTSRPFSVSLVRLCCSISSALMRFSPSSVMASAHLLARSTS
ncbi:MAG: hypothetical protein QM756_37130 [Polyangiaceae bacterium]